MTREPSTHELILPLFAPTAGANNKKYTTLVADPPWDYRDHLGDGPKGAAGQYPCMSIAELQMLPVGAWAADNSHLYLWTVNAFLVESHQVAKSWGFVPRTMLTWVKGRLEGGRLVPHIGLGAHFTGVTPNTSCFACEASCSRFTMTPPQRLLPRAVRIQKSPLPSTTWLSTSHPAHTSTCSAGVKDSIGTRGATRPSTSKSTATGTALVNSREGRSTRARLSLLGMSRVVVGMRARATAPTKAAKSLLEASRLCRPRPQTTAHRGTAMAGLDACYRCEWSKSAHSRYWRERYPDRPVCERYVWPCSQCGCWRFTKWGGVCLTCSHINRAYRDAERNERWWNEAPVRERQHQLRELHRGQRTLREIKRLIRATAAAREPKTSVSANSAGTRNAPQTTRVTRR